MNHGAACLLEFDSLVGEREKEIIREVLFLMNVLFIKGGGRGL